jgi:hypothetical protein
MDVYAAEARKRTGVKREDLICSQHSSRFTSTIDAADVREKDQLDPLKGRTEDST